MIRVAVRGFIGMTCLALMAACTGNAGSTGDPTGSAASTSEPSPWERDVEQLWTNSIKPLSDPVLAGDAVVMYVADGSGGEYMQGLDAHTGSSLWTAPSIAGGYAPGVEHYPVVTEIDGVTVVAFLAPSTASPSPMEGYLSIVNAYTGESIAPELASQVIDSFRPGLCGDAETICIDVWDEPSQTVITKAYDHATRSLTSALPPGSGYTEGGRGLGGAVSEQRVDGIEYLRYGTDGTIHWSVPYESIFDVGYSSDAGWAWYDEDDTPLIGVGYPRRARPEGESFDVTTDLAASMLVGVAREDGRRLWAHAGVTDCAPADGVMIVDDVVVACRAIGQASFHVEGGVPSDPVLVGVSVELVGFDSATGEERWNVPLGDDASNLDSFYGDAAAAKVGEIPMARISGMITPVDPVSGELTDLPPDSALLCLEKVDPVQITGLYTEQGGDTYAVADRLRPCAADGQDAAADAISAGTLETTGKNLDGIVVLNLTTGITAFRVKA